MIDEFLQHSRKLIKKKAERSWRVSAGLLAYTYEPAQTTNAPEKTKTETVNNTNQCKLKNQ
jgi:hypothetical protein